MISEQEIAVQYYVVATAAGTVSTVILLNKLLYYGVMCTRVVTILGTPGYCTYQLVRTLRSWMVLTRDILILLTCHHQEAELLPF